MANNTIKGFKIKGVPHVLDATYLSGTTKEELLAGGGAGIVASATTAQNAEAIGLVEKYSGVYGGKQREGLKFKNNVGDANEALIELNEKGNFAIESLKKHLNLESAQGVQIKPTTTVILDSSRRIETNKGNEINVEAKFDDYKDRTNPEYNGKDGYDEEYAELKIKSRNLDLRCHQHGGIALQIAGKDGHGNENKIKFESDRTSPIGSTGVYNGEGGKGLEFGTFNNNHASLYCGDYRFKGDAQVYAVTRGAIETTSTGKQDYPTQGDDFKDILDQNKKATWNEIINAAKQCSGLSRTVKEEIQAAALEAGGVDITDFVTRSNVETMVADAIAEAGVDTTGLATEQWVLDQNYISSLPDGLQYIKRGKDKGNFAVDVKGKYTWEQTGPKAPATTPDEYGNSVEKGARVVNYTNEAFYLDENKVYYKAGEETTLADGTTVVPKDTIVYKAACNIDFSNVSAYTYVQMNDGEESFYEDPTKFYYKCKAKNGDFYADGTAAPKDAIVQGAGLTAEEIAYYDSKDEILDEDGVTVLQKAIWAKTYLWKKSTLWTPNELNINLETDSKIKLAGKKIETVWEREVNGVDVTTKMDDILLSTNTLSTDANEVVFEQKISKNGDREGQDSDIVYTFGNNVADTTKVANFAEFKKNYNGKHTPKTDEELQAMYDAFLAEGQSFEIRVKVSELLGLVARVADLERRVAILEGQTPEQN